MRTQGSAAVRKALRDAEASGQMEEAFDALNVLGSTPWRINTGVYDVMKQVGGRDAAGASYAVMRCTGRL